MSEGRVIIARHPDSPDVKAIGPFYTDKYLGVAREEAEEDGWVVYCVADVMAYAELRVRLVMAPTRRPVMPVPGGGLEGREGVACTPPTGGKIIPHQSKETHPPIYRHVCIPWDSTRVIPGDEVNDLGFCIPGDARPVFPAMTRERFSRRTPSLSSASAVPSPAIWSIRRNLVMGGRSASTSAASMSWSIGSRRRPPGMHEPMSAERYGRTASLSCSPQNDRHRTCFPGASYSSDRRAPQPSTGQFARHCPFRSRRPSRAGDQ